MFNRAGGRDTPCFSYVWQPKDLREAILYVWQGKKLEGGLQSTVESRKPRADLLGRAFFAGAPQTVPCGGMPPPVFCEKRLQVIEYKRRDREKERKERKRAGKRMKMLSLTLRQGGRGERKDRTGLKARVERDEKSVEGVGESICVWR